MKHALWLLVWLAILPFEAQAHALKISSVKIIAGPTETTVSVTIHAHTLGQTDPQTAVSERLKLELDDQRFVASDAQVLRDAKNGVFTWQAKYPANPKTIAVLAPMFPEKVGEATLVTVFRERQVWAEALLNPQNPSTSWNQNGEKPSAFSVFWRFGREGVVHIFGGPDHILFLLCLPLLGGNWRQLLKIVTAFTLAHSITLLLAATGVLTLPPRFVEPVIALSIVIAALANWKALKRNDEAKRRDFRPAIAFGFGLIHGFGFAGALAELGLPREALGLALVAFNGGVEVGQAAIVMIFAPLLAGAIKFWPRLRVPVVFYGSGAVALVGAFWFAQRIFSA